MAAKEYKSEQYKTTFTQRPDNTIFGMLAGKDEFSLAVAKLGSIVNDKEFRTKFGLPEKIEESTEVKPELTEPHVATGLEKIRNLIAAGASVAVLNVALYVFLREYFGVIPRVQLAGLTLEESRHWFALFETGMMDTMALMMMYQVIESRQKVTLPQRIKETFQRGLTGLKNIGKKQKSEAVSSD